MNDSTVLAIDLNTAVDSVDHSLPVISSKHQSQKSDLASQIILSSGCKPQHPTFTHHLS